MSKAAIVSFIGIILWTFSLLVLSVISDEVWLAGMVGFAIAIFLCSWETHELRQIKRKGKKK